MRRVLKVTLAVFLVALPGRAQDVDERTRQAALAHYLEGRDLMQSEKWEEAEAEFRDALRLDPLLVLAHYDLGQTLMAEKEYPDAVRAFVGARDAYQKVAALRYTDLASAEHRRQDAIRDLKDAIRQIQGNTLLTQQQRDMRTTPLESQVQQLEAQRNLAPGQTAPPPEFTLALGSAYFRSGALADAERTYLEAIQARPKFGEAHNNLGVVFMMTGRLEQARKELELAEKYGYRVNPQLKQDLERKIKGL